MNDKNMLNKLLDFSDIRKNKVPLEPSQTEETGEDSNYQNQAILRSFKDLREKLKISQKQNNQLKEQNKIQDIRLRQNQEALEAALASNVELKAQVQKQSEGIYEMKKRFHQMRQQLQKFTALQQQLAFTKEALLQSKLKEKSLTQQKKKSMSIFLQQKMSLQEQISKLAAKVRSNESFISQLEQNHAKQKEHTYKLQNKVRKMSISFEQNNFTNKFNKQNFETQHLIDSIQQYQKQITTLKGKLAKEKERRYLLEQQMIHLQQSAGINNVKATTYENQSQILSKKHDKLSKKIEDLNIKLQKGYEQKLYLEQQMIKYQMFSEELIVKLKPLLSQDLIDIIVYYQKKLQNMRNGAQIFIADDDQSFTHISQNNNEKNSLKCHRKYQFNQSNVLHPKDTNNYLKNYQTGPSAYKNYQKKQNMFNTTRFTFGDQKQNENNTSCQGIQGKIRKERDQMEKKLKEKWFHKKFQCSMPSQLYKLRAQYITTFIDR